MSFITEVPCKFIFRDVHMRNSCRQSRAFDSSQQKCRYLFMCSLYLPLSSSLFFSFQISKVLVSPWQWTGRECLYLWCAV